MPETTEELLRTSRFRVVRHTYPSARGDVVVRESVQHPGAVVIIPLVDAEKVCLIRNFRPAVGETLVELPAGTLDPGESPELTARRELIEETGYRCERLVKLHEFFMSPGILNERMHLFAAEGLTAGETAREPSEEIDNWVVPWADAIAMAQDGRIHDAKSLVGLLLYDRIKNR